MLMPTPCVFWSGEVDPFAEFPEDQQTTDVTIFYATDRPAKGDMDDRKYANGRAPVVRLGEVTCRLGGSSRSWPELYEASMAKDRKGSWPLRLENAHEYGTLTASVADRAGQTNPALLDPAGQRAWAEAINRQLDRSNRRVINIYVHGANVGFYDSVVVAAQFFHFQGRDGVMIAFSWPTRQSPLFYAFDKKESKKSIPNFVELLDFLAANTEVAQINALGYSAGGPLLAGGLARLRERYPDLDEAQLQEKLHIGNVFFAASDADLRDFVENDLRVFHPLPQSIRITISRDDPILRMVGAFGGGKVGDARAEQLTEEELKEFDHVLPKIDVIDVSYSEKGREGGSFGGHGYWYTNAWVATDVLSSFRWDVEPEVRGLARIEGEDTWYYPKDYPQRITDLVVRVRSGEFVPSGR